MDTKQFFQAMYALNMNDPQVKAAFAKISQTMWKDIGSAQDPPTIHLRPHPFASSWPSPTYLRVTAKLANGAEVYVACKAERDDRMGVRFRCGNCNEAVLYNAGDVCAWCGAVAS